MKEWLGLIAAVMAIAAHVPYVADIIRRKTKPHVFTWLIWAMLTLFVFFGQWERGAGPGSWSTMVAGSISIFVAILSLKYGTKDITKLDKVFFGTALISIIPWYLTKDPTISVLLLTGIDGAAFIPTIRKTANDPSSETLFTYALNVPRHAISIAAIAQYNAATYIYPSMLVIMNVAVVITIVLFRLKKKVSKA